MVPPGSLPWLFRPCDAQRGHCWQDGKTWPKVQHLFLCGRARDCTIPLPGAEPAGAYAASVTGILQQGASFSGNIAQVLSVVRTFAEAG